MRQAPGPRPKKAAVVLTRLAFYVWPVALVFLTGCPPQPPLENAGTQPVVAPPAYRKIALRYNRNIAGLTQFWSRVVVEVEWEHDGKQRREQGEGNLIVRLPAQLALSVGKLGNTMFWIGSDTDRYWLFDLEDGRVLYTGRHAHIGLPHTKPFPVPVQPLQLVRLLGIIPLDPDNTPDAAGVNADNNVWVITPPGTDMRLFLDPRTVLPKRIELLDQKGRPVVVAELNDPEPTETTGRPPGSGPLLARRIEITLPGRYGRIALHLADVSDGVTDDRIHDQAFDLPTLIKALKPQHTENLDEP